MREFLIAAAAIRVLFAMLCVLWVLCGCSINRKGRQESQRKRKDEGYFLKVQNYVN